MYILYSPAVLFKARCTTRVVIEERKSARATQLMSKQSREETAFRPKVLILHESKQFDILRNRNRCRPIVCMQSFRSSLSSAYRPDQTGVDGLTMRFSFSFTQAGSAKPWRRLHKADDFDTRS